MLPRKRALKGKKMDLQFSPNYEALVINNDLDD